MNPNADPRTDSTVRIDDIEERIREIFSAQKSEVEQSLVARITREKEEAQRRIEAVNLEFAQVRGLLDDHKSVMLELQTTEQHLRGEIRGHFDRAVNYQKMMENAAALAGDELEKIGGLNDEIEKVRVRAEAEYAELKRHLAGYAGLVAQLPAPPSRPEHEVNWSEEIDKLRKVRDLLATLRQAAPAVEETAPAADTFAPLPAGMTLERPTVPAIETAEELAASLGLIDRADDSVHDDAEFALNDPAWSSIPGGNPAQTAAAPAELAPETPVDIPAEPESEPEPIPAAETQAAEPEVPEAPAAPAVDPALTEALARYRRSESVNNGLEVGFYTTETASWLDALSFMDAMAHVMEGAGQLHAQLTQTTSVKDLFLLKQEILNQQEILRKLFFRVVRFCDKEGGRLPEQMSEIIGSRGMKDIIERLTMANWSDPSDFRPFVTELTALKRAFETRTSALPCYEQAVLDEIEGRNN